MCDRNDLLVLRLSIFGLAIRELTVRTQWARKEISLPNYMTKVSSLMPQGTRRPAKVSSHVNLPAAFGGLNKAFRCLVLRAACDCETGMFKSRADAMHSAGTLRQLPEL